MPYTVGSVPFLNAKPLVWAFEQLGENSPVKLVYEWPSKLPALLDSGEASAVLVSSIDALTVPNRVIAADCSICSRNAVMSVRLFSKVPFDRISTLALDSSSMTSNALARLLLLHIYGCQPDCSRESPEGHQMLADHDACVLIGDKGLLFDGTGLYELDLGEAWSHLTGLPFVWACWVGGTDLTPELASHLRWAREIGQQNLASVALSAPPEIPQQLAVQYLNDVFDYRLENDQREGLRKFGELLSASNLVEHIYQPDLIAPLAATISDPASLW